jgi:hypothetical protein
MENWQQFGLVLSITAVLTIGLWWLFPKFRRDPEEKERRRRIEVSSTGRLGDAEITDVQGNSLFYSYSVRGVAYTAAQDISRLKNLLPDQPERLIGPVMLKYAPGNPANSIVVCEDWSGLRSRTLKARQQRG